MLRKMFTKFFILSFSVVSLTSCATIFSGTSQAINVQVIDDNTRTLIIEPNCLIIDVNNRTMTLPSNPGTVTIDKSASPIIIDCKKAGYKQAQIGAGNNFNAVTFINILFWPGFIVDALSGAYKKFPTHFVVTMKQL
ncbi:hypothetical protein [Rickettsiales endosymbiont of Stachyamoeba lipophora]|uniref:hypothetical protein n=1 Tax=Rickettsiales endosymbiont of Stachyamoeba lipophora TaxID=2486578 RepID=UPI000F647AB4|nr:hypothetical protein [Rickettsiales endosymbiont of Stachyamoeba lipophora]AZL16274.1 hypothetical protein EF513_07010 [Rickettsiales endosymbiont of Stachyamoeba lipophora]